MAKKAAGKVSFKSSYAEFRRIMDDLKRKNYKGSYLLMGQEDYFIDRICDTIATTVIDEEEREFSQMVFYGKDSNPNDIISALRSYPMLSEKCVVILKEAQSLKGLEQLQHYFKQPLESTLFVVCYKGGNLDKRSALYKRLVESGEVFESVSARDYEVGEWIIELVRGEGRGIDPVALSMLVEYLGTSLSKIVNEITKLLTRIDPSVKNITPTHIEENIGISKDFNNFELTKALSECNWRKALLIANHFAQDPKNNPIVVTVSSLFTHFQRIFTLGLIVWNCGKNKAPMPSDIELMQKLKLTNTFFLREYKDAVRSYPSSRSFKILAMIRECDARSKGIGTGSATHGDLLVELIQQIKNCK